MDTDLDSGSGSGACTGSRTGENPDQDLTKKTGSSSDQNTLILPKKIDFRCMSLTERTSKRNLWKDAIKGKNIIVMRIRIQNRSGSGFACSSICLFNLVMLRAMCTCEENQLFFKLISKLSMKTNALNRSD